MKVGLVLIVIGIFLFIPVERVDIIVTGSGTTTIHLDTDFSELANVHGIRIPSVTVDSRFSNTQVLSIHDVGITQATLSTTSGTPGVIIAVNVTVANLGNYTENVLVYAQYNRTETDPVRIGIKNIRNFAPYTTSISLTFTWDTGNVAAKIYEITVVASLDADDKMSDNTRIAGFVKLTLLDEMLAKYDALNSTYNELLSELNLLRNFIYIQIVATIALVAAVVYLAIRKPKIKPLFVRA